MKITPGVTGGRKKILAKPKPARSKPPKLLQIINPPSRINVVCPPQYKTQGRIIREKVVKIFINMLYCKQ